MIATSTQNVNAHYSTRNGGIYGGEIQSLHRKSRGGIYGGEIQSLHRKSRGGIISTR